MLLQSFSILVPSIQCKVQRAWNSSPVPPWCDDRLRPQNPPATTECNAAAPLQSPATSKDGAHPSSASVKGDHRLFGPAQREKTTSDRQFPRPTQPTVETSDCQFLPSDDLGKITTVRLHHNGSNYIPKYTYNNAL